MSSRSPFSCFISCGEVPNNPEILEHPFEFPENLIDRVHKLTEEGTITAHYFSAVLSECCKGAGTEGAVAKEGPIPMRPAVSTRPTPFPKHHNPNLSYSTTLNNHCDPDCFSMTSQRPPSQRLKFILHPPDKDRLEDDNSQTSNHWGVLVGIVLPALPYQLERIAGTFYSNTISPFVTSTRAQDYSLCCSDFTSQVNRIFKCIDNCLRLLNSTKQDIISISFSIVDLGKYANIFSRELSIFMPAEICSSTIMGVTCLIPPESRIQANMTVLVRNAMLTNFSVQKY